MEIMGYNLSNNKLPFLKSALESTNGLSNIYFGFSNRSGVDWNRGALIYANSSVISGTGISNILDDTDIKYYVSFFGEDETTVGGIHYYRILKTGDFNSGSWRSSFILIDKLSTTTADDPLLTNSAVEILSLDSLISQQNSQTITDNDKFQLYKTDNTGDIGSTEFSKLSEYTIGTVYNSESTLYNQPMNSRLSSTGIIDGSTLFSGLKHVINISDGSYSKCYNLSMDTINKIETGIVNPYNTVFDLINDYDITIIKGLKYKSIIKINDVDYACIFEYATQTGSKNLIITTENFNVENSTQQLGIFVDANRNLTNTNSVDISPIEHNLLNNNILGESLNFKFSTMPTKATESVDGFFNYLLNDDFIDHNRIRTSQIQLLSEFPLPNYTEISVNGKRYYSMSLASDIDLVDAIKYNIKNFLITVNIRTDLIKNPDKDYRYDVRYYDQIGKQGLYISNSPNTPADYSMDGFRLKEIMIYHKQLDGSFIPIYYSRTDVIIDGNLPYQFQIII